MVVKVIILVAIVFVGNRSGSIGNIVIGIITSRHSIVTIILMLIIIITTMFMYYYYFIIVFTYTLELLEYFIIIFLIDFTFIIINFTTDLQP